MGNVTAADIVSRITLTNGATHDVRAVLADRINARAVLRRLGVPEDNNEIKAYAIAYTAAKRTGIHFETFEQFAEVVVDVSPYTLDGRPVGVRDGVLWVDDTEVDMDPTQPDHSSAG